MRRPLSLVTAVIFGLVHLLPAQSGRATIDSIGISDAIATHLIARSATDGTRVLVIDPTAGRWNALTRLAVLRRAPSLVPVLTDSASWYATHFNVDVIAVTADSASASIGIGGCYSPWSSAGTHLTWSLTRSGGAWAVREQDWVLTEHGVCKQFIPAAQDSAVIGVIMSALTEQLAPQIAAAARDTMSHPWQITLPATSKPGEWSAAADRLRQLLRARAPRSGEEDLSSAGVSMLKVVGDSLTAELMLSRKLWCSATAWREHMVLLAVTSTRSGGRWGSPAVKQVYDDDVNCEVH